MSESQITDAEASLKIISGILGKEIDTLGRIFEITQDISPEARNTIFENPRILQALMKDGVYTDNGYNINLANGEIEL